MPRVILKGLVFEVVILLDRSPALDCTTIGRAFTDFRRAARAVARKFWCTGSATSGRPVA